MLKLDQQVALSSVFDVISTAALSLTPQGVKIIQPVACETDVGYSALASKFWGRDRAERRFWA